MGPPRDRARKLPSLGERRGGWKLAQSPRCARTYEACVRSTAASGVAIHVRVAGSSSGPDAMLTDCLETARRALVLSPPMARRLVLARRRQPGRLRPPPHWPTSCRSLLGG